MNNLSKECIEQIQQVIEVKFPLEDNENWDENMNEQGRVSFMDGARFALTNQKIYQSAGLIKAQDILPETFKTEAVNTILVNALRYLNDEQTSHLLKAICQRKKDAALEAGLMTVEEALRFAEWCHENSFDYTEFEGWQRHDCFYTTTDLLTIFRNQNKEK